MCRKMGQEKSCCLPPFHSFTGCYHHHIFFCKTKKSAWHTWNAYPDVNSAFPHMAENPYDEVSLTSQFFPLLERFTILLYDKSGILNSVNEARLDLFCKKNKNLESLSPTQVHILFNSIFFSYQVIFFLDVLLQHVRRAYYRSSIWTTSHLLIQRVPTPEDWGWIDDADSGWIPIWMTIPIKCKKA